MQQQTVNDFNDLHQEKGLEAVRETINVVQRIPYVPFGYSINDDGVVKKEDNEDVLVCSPLYIEALARDDNGNNWGRLLVWHDRDGKKHEWAMPNFMLAGDGAEYRRILLDGGLKIYSGKKAQNALHDYIMNADPPTRAISVNMPGWHGKQYIAVDGMVYGQGKDKMLLQTSGVLSKPERKGTLNGWQNNVARYAIGNSRLVFSISTALAGTLLYFVNEGSGGFHFSGESSGGKTTALRVGSSVWGTAMRSWRTTDNAAESWGRLANDGFLALDELGQVDGKAADQMSYMLGNGQTKGRANRDGMARDTTEFRLMFLSTGEIGLAEKMGEGKKKARAGQTVRMIEIPADAGRGIRLFEELHGFQNGDELAKHLRQATEENKGHAATAWLEELAQMDDEGLRSILSTKIKQWMDLYMPSGADGQVIRVTRRFALVVAAGELAVTFGIVPWSENEASNAAARCFQAWLDARGGSGSHEIQSGIRDILSFIERYSSSRFADKEIPGEKINDRAGFWSKKSNGEIEYMIFPDVLRSEILGGSKNIGAILQAAVQQELIEPDGDGKTSKPVNLPGLGKKRMVCVIPARYKGENAP